MGRVIPTQWVDPATGRLTQAAVLYLNDLDNGGENSIGTLLAGVNAVTATTTAIVNGTQPLADVLITGVGSVSDSLESQTANTNSAATAAAAGALTASVSPGYASGSRVGTGTVTTNTVTVTPAGGTAPYFYAWAYADGDTVAAINAPSAATTDFDILLTAPAPIKSGLYQCTVTDSAAGTYIVYVNVSGIST